MLALLLCLFPAPAQPDEFRIVGHWQLSWGACEQHCYFASNGDYDAVNFGPGTWTATVEDGVITVEFSERGRGYRMSFDREGNGIGGRVDMVPDVKVKMRRVGDEQRPKR